MADPQQVASAFCNHYYSTFSQGVESLAGLYNEKSMLTFEGSQFQGTQAILTKLSSIGRVQHTVKSMDVQPSADPNSLVVFITGSVQIDGGNPLHFCEFFQLVSNSPGSYYVHNDIFRLNYGL